MKLDLDRVMKEAEDYLRNAGFVVFYGAGPSASSQPEIEWDTEAHPDYEPFLDVARSLDVKLIVLRHRLFNSELIDSAVEQLQDSGLEYDEQRSLENRLRELGKYDGFTGAFEMSFQHQGSWYLFELRAPWFEELNDLLEEMDLNLGVDDEGGPDDTPYGGYYSRN